MSTHEIIATETAIIELEKFLAEAKSDNEAMAVVLRFINNYSILKKIETTFKYNLHFNGTTFKITFHFFNKKKRETSQTVKVIWHAKNTETEI